MTKIGQYACRRVAVTVQLDGAEVTMFYEVSADALALAIAVLRVAHEAREKWRRL